MTDLVRELSELGCAGQRHRAHDACARSSEIAAALRDGAPSNISVFAGRVADTGRDPVPMMAEALAAMADAPAPS